MEQGKDQDFVQMVQTLKDRLNLYVYLFEDVLSTVHVLSKIKKYIV